MNSHSSATPEAISERAYHLWNDAGRPDGLHDQHWLQAEKELNQHSAKEHGAKREAVEPPTHKHPAAAAPHTANYQHPGVTTDSLHHRR